MPKHEYFDRPDGRIRRTDIWREGKWLDLWSVVHFLTGISVALGLSIFRFGVLAATVIAFLIFVSYEFWEAMVQIKETPQNRFMDVIVGMLSSLLTYVYLTPFVSGGMFVFVFVSILTVNIAMATFGWLTSRKAVVLQEKLRAEYLEQRKRLLERRARRRELVLRRRLERRASRSSREFL